MKASDIFGICVRVVGLAVIAWSSWSLLTGVHIVLVILLNLPAVPDPTFRDAISYPMTSYFVVGVPMLALGAYCFFRADRVVRMAYGRAQPSAAPNVGPAASVASSEAGKGPPSVS